jgi:lysophospholipase L1-like esterase
VLSVVSAACGGSGSPVATVAETPAPTRPPEPIRSVVAIGDSYTAGVGTVALGQVDDEACGRTPSAYPTLVGLALDADVVNVACSGATTADVAGQLAQVPADTDLVVLTVGGNDAGFADKVVGCVLDSCSWADEPPPYAPADLATSLAALYRQLLNRVDPQAFIRVVTYPDPFAPDDALAPGEFCGPVERADVPAVRGFLAEVNEAVRAAAADVNDDRLAVVDGVAAVRDLGQCRVDGGTDIAVNGVVLSPLTDSFHPTALGYERLAAAVVATVAQPA